MHCLPGSGAPNQFDGIECFDDGLLVVDAGYIRDVGHYANLHATLSDDVPIVDHSGSFVVPGFIDCHVHYPQIEMVASYGERLLDWLTTYTFPCESKFGDPEYARSVAARFVAELLRNGTTSAMVFSTVHPESVDALFEAAYRHNMRLFTGKVLMDRNCPPDLRDSPARGDDQSRQLIERWHGKGRLGYAITPRFAPTSSDAQLQRAGALAQEFPSVHIQTHLAESQPEVAWVRELFPAARSYLDVYDQAGLVTDRSVFAHSIHTDTDDLCCLAEQGAAIAFCPSSNLFLGSGLFNLARARDHDVQVGLGTDVGAGTNLSILSAAADGYKVLQLQDQNLSPGEAFYLATLGGAKALSIDHKVGNFEKNKEADFCILSRAATPLIEQRIATARGTLEELFALIILADDRSVTETFVSGVRVHPP